MAAPSAKMDRRKNGVSDVCTIVHLLISFVWIGLFWMFGGCLFGFCRWGMWEFMKIDVYVWWPCSNWMICKKMYIECIVYLKFSVEESLILMLIKYYCLMLELLNNTKIFFLEINYHLISKLLSLYWFLFWDF